MPYDCGVVAVRDREAHAAAMGMSAAYLIRDASARSNSDWVPEASRRGRGFAVYAALRSLGRAGVAELVERNCALARRLAERVAAGGVEVLNDVVLNQVLLGVEEDVIARVQADGVLWAGGTRVARPPGDARLGLELVDHRGRHRPLAPTRSSAQCERAADRRDDGLGLVGELAPGEAQDGVAEGLEVAVLAAVALEGAARRVEGVAVDLDDEAVRLATARPLPSPCACVGLRLGEAGLADQRRASGVRLWSG